MHSFDARGYDNLPKELILEQDMMNAVFEDIFAPLIIIDSKHEIYKINKAALPFVGNEKKMKYAIPELYVELIELSKSSDFQKNFEMDIKDRQMLVKISKISETNMLVIFEDLSKEHFLTAQLKQAQKMESIGQLATGIAHDFNNLLTVIGGNINLIKRKTNDGELVDNLDQIYSLLLKGSSMIRKLLEFSRISKSNLSLTNINTLISSVSAMAERLLRDNIKVITELYKSDLHVMAEPNSIEQCIINLLTNAQDAMPAGGVITVKTDLLESNEFMPDKPCILIQVSDTGEGMNPETLTHIFDPFFTTKPAQKGTGLGLAMVSNTIKHHKGKIICDSYPGKGTTFNIYLEKYN